jgi:hypothetical protein
MRVQSVTGALRIIYSYPIDFMLIAFIAGLLMSFIGSMIPTGPIALIVIRRGAG